MHKYYLLTAEVKNMQITNMNQTAEMIGVTYSALQSAIFHKKLPEPKLKIGSLKVFDPEEVAIARQYFEQKRQKTAAGRRT